MKKFWIQFAFLGLLAIGSLYLFKDQALLEPFLPWGPAFTKQQLKIGNSVVNIEVADTATKRSKGLSGRESLATGSGMLFVFPEENQSLFWMKDMKFPIDFIFISNGVVVDLLKNIPPPAPNTLEANLQKYRPVVPVDMVLEVNANFIDQQRVNTGETVYLIQQ